MKLLSAHQHNHGWWEARNGRCSGSHMADMLGFLKVGAKKGGENADRKRYRVKIATEIMLGRPLMDGYLSPAMMHGVEYEPLARAAYEFRTGNDVELVGFGVHDTIERFGGSCDGLVGTDGIFEAKCPEPHTHVGWMDAGILPPEHEPQCAAYLSITGRQWVDFVSFEPRMPERYQLFVVRMMRNEERMREVEAGAIQFLSDVDATFARLNAMNPEPTADLREQLHASLDDTEGQGITDDDIEWITARHATQE